MLKSKVGYSINEDYYLMGLETAKDSTKDFSNVRINFLYTSEKCDIKKVIKGVQEVTSAPIIGCTSHQGIIVPDGYITSDHGFAGMLSINDQNIKCK